MTLPPEGKYIDEALPPPRYGDDDILTALEAGLSPLGVDWKKPADAMDESEVLYRLASLNVRLPEDNIATQKDQHNITLENYIKLALGAAGTDTTLEKFLTLVLYRLDEPDPPPHIAQQAMLIWAPAAEIMGWYRLKRQLEEASFAFLYPDERRAVHETYEHLGGDEALEKLADEYQQGLAALLGDELDGVPLVVETRRKSDFSVWRKCRQRGQDTYELPDYFGIRIIVDEPDAELATAACYRVRDVLAQFFKEEYDRYKDYIYRPKPNGYQSIHQTLQDTHNGARFESQIRTAAMHLASQISPEVSHMAYEASRKYTPGRYVRPETRRPHRIYNWRDEVAREIRERQEESRHDLDYLRPGKVLAFSYTGNLYELDAGSAALDFSFALHSDQALRTRTIYINNQPARFSDVVAHGDVIRIEYQVNGQETWRYGWFDTVSSDKALKRLERAARLREKEALIKRGQELVEDGLKQLGLPGMHRLLSESDRLEIAQTYGLGSYDLLLRQIGDHVDGFGPGRIINRVQEIIGERTGQAGPKEKRTYQRTTEGIKLGLAILDTPHCEFHFAGCCGDTTGQPAVAVSCPSRGDFAIHQPDCTNLGKRQVLSCSWYEAE